MRINSKGLDIIKKYEGLRLKAYKCPAGVWTVGYGSTSDVKKGMEITEVQADGRLLKDIIWSENVVMNKVEVRLNSNQFSALVSLVFNIGSGNFSKSTLLKKLNANDLKGAAEEFPKWRKAGGKILKGLVARRKEEMELFIK